MLGTSRLRGYLPASKYGRFPIIRGTFFGVPHNKDYSIMGSILGSPHLGKLPYIASTAIQPPKLLRLQVRGRLTACATPLNLNPSRV